MKIVGIDPGTAITGYACLESFDGRFKLHKHGCIKTNSETEISNRIKQIYEEISALIDWFQPDVVALERQFFNRNVTNALFVGHASGVILLAAAQRGVPVSMYTPLQVKQSIAGYGKASKKQVQYMVKNLLGLLELPKPDDAADAIAVAICHANISLFEKQFERME
ncbi:MAG: crossover junction endodeoxyribonuclease RuvC [Actinobacteria bacterium]|nr:crossover junction endodeoxyribonuclease RuvC [Actinomycetota bacterium]